MTSQINPNNIDGNYPVAGVDNNSQGFRDNFTNTQLNFQYAEDEINDLQNKVLLKAALSGQVLDNNMDGNLLTAAQIRDFRSAKVAISSGSGSITVDYAAGHYQTISTTGAVSLSFANFPTLGAYGLMRIQIHVTDVAHTMTLPAAVSLGLSGIQGISPGISGVSNTITFGATGFYEFAFGSSDSGSTITLFDLNRALTNFTAGNLQSSDVTATNNVTAGNAVIGSAVVSTGNISASGTVIAGSVSTGLSGNITGGNVIALSTFSTTGAVTAGTVNAVLNPTAGTTAVAPIKMSSGSVLTTAQSGAIELGGSVFYATPVSAANAQRGVLAAQHVIVTPTAGRTLADDTSVQAIFDSPSSGTIRLTATTTYEMEAYLVITNAAAPSTAHSISLSFNYTGTLANPMSYIADVTTSSGDPSAGATSVSRSYGSSTSALQITPAGTTTSNEVVVIHLRGMLRTNATGLFTPQIQYNTNGPGSTSTVVANSWFKLAAWGDSTLVSVGNWS
jgi:hypothetical protein